MPSQPTVGNSVGNTVGSEVGTLVGAADGALLGDTVGELVGCPVGPAVGTCVGITVGESVVGGGVQKLVQCPGHTDANCEVVQAASSPLREAGVKRPSHEGGSSMPLQELLLFGDIVTVGHKLHFPGHSTASVVSSQVTFAQPSGSGVPWQPNDGAAVGRDVGYSVGPFVGGDVEQNAGQWAGHCSAIDASADN